MNQDLITNYVIIVLSLSSYLFLAVMIIYEDIPDNSINNLKRKHFLVGFTWPVWISVIIMAAVLNALYLILKFLYKLYNVLIYNNALGNPKSVKISQKEIQSTKITMKETTNEEKKTPNLTYEEKEQIITNTLENDM